MLVEFIKAFLSICSYPERASSLLYVPTDTNFRSVSEGANQEIPYGTAALIHTFMLSFRLELVVYNNTPIFLLNMNDLLFSRMLIYFSILHIYLGIHINILVFFTLYTNLF